MFRGSFKGPIKVIVRTRLGFAVPGLRFRVKVRGLKYVVGPS